MVGSLSATIRDVARKAGVSVATVSRVVNNQGGVRPATAEKINKAMQELNYIPNVLARSVASQKSYLLGMIIPDIENPFFAAVYTGVNKIAGESSYTTLLGDSEDKIEREEELVRTMLEHRASGLILTPVFENAEWLSRVKIDVPVCLVDRDIEGMDCDRVLIDNVSGAYEATKLLIKNGHTRIGVITGPLDSTPGKERYNGYQKCLKEQGIPIEPVLVKIGDFREGSGYRLGGELLKAENPPTAILSCNNLMTLGLLEAINSSEVKVGSDVAVVGFDDISVATLMEPRLTVVSRPMREMGEWAAKLLLKRIINPNSPKQLVMMTPNLIVRGSEVLR